MNGIKITDDIKYIGVYDNGLDLFESQYPIPDGVSYNSYLIKDEKNLVMDTVDKTVGNKWIENLENELNGEKVDYLLISHLEPDHSYNIRLLCEKYPSMKLIGNTKTFELLPQFFEIENLEQRKVVVKENDSISTGKHTLRFYMAPMVHWPEVMATYEETNKILFSADGFGRFGSIDEKQNWEEEARRYYFNIVGKYGPQVQMLLKKLSNIEVEMICPLHGPILKENLGYYINKYDMWSKYESENEGVFIAYTSIYGNTKKVAEKLQSILKENGKKEVVISDLARSDLSENVSKAFKYKNIVLASPSYNTKVFPPMEQFLRLIKDKNYQKRNIAIIENGTWAPSAAKTMLEIIVGMKEIEIIEPKITIKTTMNEHIEKQLEILAENILKN